jgi:hypothetical protein
MTGYRPCNRAYLFNTSIRLIAPLSPACGKMFKCPLTVGPGISRPRLRSIKHSSCLRDCACADVIWGWLLEYPYQLSRPSGVRERRFDDAFPGVQYMSPRVHSYIGGSRHVSAMFWGSDINYSRTGLVARLESMTQHNPSLAA